MQPILKFSARAVICASALALWPGALGAAESEPRVYRDKVEPHWFADAQGVTNQFWYRVELSGGEREFLLVKAADGQRVSAFDQARLAEALSQATGRTLEAKKLPIETLAFTPDLKSVSFEFAATNWSVQLADYSLTGQAVPATAGDALPVGKLPHPSPATEDETSIHFVNQLAREVDVFWLDDQGERQAYGSLKPGEERDQHTYVGHVWLLAEKSGDVLAVFDAEASRHQAVLAEAKAKLPPPVAPPAAPEKVRSPDGNWQVFVRGHDLFLQDTKGGPVRQLTFDGHLENGYARNAEMERAIDMDYETRDPERPTPEVYWAPDSKHFVAMRFKTGSNHRIYMVESSPKDQLQPKLVSLPYLKAGDDVPYAKPHLFAVDPAREITLDDTLFTNPWATGEVHWWPDSVEFTFLYNQRGHQVMRILGVNATNGVVRPIVDESSKTFIDYSGKYFSECLDETHEILWMSERDGWNHLYLYDARTGKVKKQVTQGEWVVRAVDRVDHEHHQVYFQAGGLVPEQDPYYIQYCRVNLDGSGLTTLTGGDGTHTIQYSPDQRYLIDTWSRVDLPPINELRRTEDGKLLCRLEAADAGDLPLPERFVAPGRDGQTPIYGVIFWPKNYDSHQKYPVLEYVYAGPQDSFVPKAFQATYRNHVLTEKGFIIVQSDGMGTSNRSKKFHDVCWKNLIDAGFPDRIGWIKAVAAKYPSLDLTRVGIYGTSAGGQTALRALLDHNDFYQAAMADSGCHDNRMDKIWWNEQWLGWPVDESYVRNSNTVDAYKLKGKLLLMVGEMDNNVDPATSYQVVDALIKADKDFELLAMPGAGHGVVRTPYGTRKLVDFFCRTFLTHS